MDVANWEILARLTTQREQLRDIVTVGKLDDTTFALDSENTLLRVSSAQSTLHVHALVNSLFVGDSQVCRRL